MAPQKCIPLVLLIFISLTLGSAHRVILEPTDSQKPENTKNPSGMTKPSSDGGGGFGWGWGGGGGGGGGGGYGGSCGSGGCNQPGIPGWIHPGIGPGGGGGGGGFNQPGYPGWSPTPGIGVPGGGCNFPTQPVPYIPCPYGCQPPPGSGCFAGSTKQIDKEKKDPDDHENGNREETISPNFAKRD